MEDINKEVIIVGGGPAGCFTALYLTSQCPDLAENIVILEAKERGREKICAGGVSGRVIATAKRDLNIDLSSLEGKWADGMTVRWKDRESSIERPRLAKVIRRQVLDAHLLDCVRDRGVTVLTESPVTGIKRRSEHIEVNTKERTFTGSAIVGADGMNGITKKALGVPRSKHKEYLWYVDLPDVEMSSGSNLVIDFTPAVYGVTGYVWFFPNNPVGPGCNAGITGGSAVNMKYLKTVFLQLAEKNIGRKLDDERLEFKIWPETFFSFSNPSYTERALFVGDKLGVTPMTGEGIGICLESAKAASRELLAALRSNDYSFKAYPRRLLTSDFVPGWVAESIFYRWKSTKTTLFVDLLFFLSTTENRAAGKTFLDSHCRVFSGAIPPWSLGSWKGYLRLVPSRELIKNLMKRGR